MTILCGVLWFSAAFLWISSRSTWEFLVILHTMWKPGRTGKLRVGGWISGLINPVSTLVSLCLYTTTSTFTELETPGSTFPQSTKSLVGHSPCCSRSLLPNLHTLFPLTPSSSIWAFDLEEGSGWCLFDSLPFPSLFWRTPFPSSSCLVGSSFLWNPKFFLPLRTCSRYCLPLNYCFNRQEAPGQHSLRKISSVSVYV